MTRLPQKLLVALAALLATSCVGASATAVIEGLLRLPNGTPVNTTRVTLNDGEHTTYTRLDGSFSFYNVEPGVHLLEAHSHTLMFSQVKIQLLEESMDSPKCIEYVWAGAPKQTLAHPLVLTAHATYQYFEKKQGFSVLSILKNPMLLMMLFSVGLMFLMPKMMENLDPEEKERVQKQMEMQKDPTKMMSQLFGDIMGGGEQEALPKPKTGPRRSKRD